MVAHAVTLRLARADDVQALAAMSRDLIEAGLGWRYSPQRMHRLMADRDTVVLVACDTAAVQGFAVMQFGDQRAHLVLLCVQPGLRRAGVGRRLLHWLLQSADVAGIESVHLELRADNDAALAFYRRMAFTETGQVPGYYGGQIAARRMVRRLRQAASSP
ncbi:GNAT family N-acetyltransferase [Ideonella sp. BN130291]|uniref:GNAT family N-acetyltransferase n=1 Tax=Ideonella sp. BN130291 TaxID=3112940 RepID=UPI002E264EC3|nr:GNAT family N-acetyltransferase [Ideonella sp. BN130291]